MANNKVLLSNIVGQKALREMQLKVLEQVSEVIGKTAGPFGSAAMIMHQDRLTEYSKDGHKVLSNLHYYRPVEAAVCEELLNITEHVVRKAGDGTTTAVQLSYLVFKALCDAEEEWGDEYTPYDIISTFQKAVEDIIEGIKASSRPLTIEDIKQICLISTNGNEMVSEDIANIYKQFGTDVHIQLGTSNTESSVLKTYDGIIMNKGYSSPSFVNKENNVCEIHNPRIYYFPDPVDTPEMIQMFMCIWISNIYQPYQQGTGDYKPTVILAPSLSADIRSALTDIEKIFYTFDTAGRREDKPPFCIITGINDRVDNIGDIVTLCDCPLIKKYINPDQRLKDIENGAAPSNETVSEFYGTADLVTIDSDKMKIINPKEMFDTSAPVAEDGSRPYTGTYNAIIAFLEKQIEIESESKTNLNAVIDLKRRLHCLKANFVEYLVGGVAAADRDNVRDLVEDAILNCRSAATHGVGYGAGLEGLIATRNILWSDDNLKKKIYRDIVNILHKSYWTIMEQLYKSGVPADEVDELIAECSQRHVAYNLREKSFNGNQVLCSVETDIAILEGISKIITIMYTANQALLIDPLQNAYMD